MGMADELKAARNESAGTISVGGTRRTDMPKINYGSSRITDALASGTLVLLFIGVWYIGANASFEWLKSLGLKFNEVWLSVLTWGGLAGVSAIEVALKRRFTNVAVARENIDVFILWMVILALDTGTTFFGLIVIMAGWKIPLGFVTLSLPKGSIELTAIAFILSIWIAISPEPMIIRFSKMFLKAVGI
jgi:hypothetical protein